MIFGEFVLAEAEGAVLAHTQRLPGRAIRKGTVLDAGSVAALRAAGRERIIAARLEAGDVGENEAADRLADALLAPGIGRSRAATGRVNLHAESAGLLLLDTAKIDRLNAVGEAVTLATLPDATVVASGEMAATIKIIPFAAPGPVLAAALALARSGGPALALHPFRPLRAGLVLTELAGTKRSVLEGTLAATAGRVAGLGGTLLPPLRCAHRTEAIAASLRALLDRGAELLMVVGASAVVDRRDVGPAAIVAAGGEIERFGMPVDPGNLICVGRFGAVPALVLPGCARSPVLNGIDWVLARLFAGQPVGSAVVGRMGVGGLLKEVDNRPMPRARSVAVPTLPDNARPEPSGVAVLVLAAGRSSRMAPRNKLLIADRSGAPMVARVVDAALASEADSVLVVVGHQHEAVQAALAGRQVRFVLAPDYADGLSASLRAGLAALPAEARAVLVCLGDMPLVPPAMLDRLIAAWEPEAGHSIAVPSWAGARGNPVLWDRRFFDEMAALDGDSGARRLLELHAAAVIEVPSEGDFVLRDFDTPDSLLAPASE